MTFRITLAENAGRVSSAAERNLQTPQLMAISTAETISFRPEDCLEPSGTPTAAVYDIHDLGTAITRWPTSASRSRISAITGSNSTSMRSSS
jgi:hypothetical protein